MLEESISCSPGKDRNHSRSRRFHKKATRKSQRMSGASSIAQNNVCEELSFLDSLYDESTQSKDCALDQYAYINPFENARIIAAADQAQQSTSNAKLRELASQGFVKLEDLPLKVDEIIAQPIPVIVPVPETQFGITESEFVRFCDDAEFGVESPPAKVAKTPKAANSIVDAIMNDFCASPYSESPPKFLADDSTPVFRFKSKSLRTYSGLRKQTPRRNIVSELANAILPDDDSNASESSGLSIQEDLSPYIVPQLNTVDLNNSIKVCENLLNLSLHFSQVSSHVKCSPEVEEKFSPSAPKTLQIRRKHFAIARGKSPDEFHGFSDVDDEEDTLKDLLDDEEDDVLQEINCDSLCYDKVVPKASLTHNFSDGQICLEGENAWIEEANRRDLDIKGEDFGRSDLQICDSSKNNLKDSSHNSLQEDEQLFDDIDLWSDNECLLNYKTQNLQPNISKPYNRSPTRRKKRGECHNSSYKSNEYNGVEKMPTEASENKRSVRDLFDQPSTSKKHANIDGTIEDSASLNFSGFLTASRKPIVISDEAQRKAKAILTKFEEAELEQRTRDDLDVPMISGEDILSHKISSLGGFSITSKYPKGTSNDATRKAEGIFGKFEQEEYEIRVKEENNNKPEDSPSTITSSTSSRKPIIISVDPKRKVTTLLKNFEQEEQAKRMITEETNQDPDTSPFVGFLTASQKPISISAGAKRKAVEILNNFEKEEREKCMSEEEDVFIENLGKNVQEQCAFPFVGFKTASKKPIAISDEAKRKASAVLEKFEKDEQDKIAKDDKNHANPSVSSFVGFSTASKKPIAISAEAKRKAMTILEKFENDERDKIGNEDKNDITPSVSSFVGFSTASRKPVAVSAEAKQKASLILNKFENDERDIFADKVKNDAIPTESSFVGFSTASKKPITISAKAKRKANAILEKFESDERHTKAEDVISSVSSFTHLVKSSENPIAISGEAKRKASPILDKFENEQRDKIAKKVINDVSPFAGFSTASKKPIAISAEAKRKASAILEKFENDERDRIAEKVKNAVTSSDSSFVGFLTASNNPIAISAEAKCKADELLKRFEQAETDERLKEGSAEQKRVPEEISEEVKQKAEDLLMDIEFFTEAFDEELSTIDQQNEGCEALPLKDPPKNMTQLLNNTLFEGFKTASNKLIQVSEDAKRHADQLLSQVENEVLPNDFLKCIEADLQEVCSSSSVVRQVDGATLKKDPHFMSEKGRKHLHATATSSSCFNPKDGVIIGSAPCAIRLPVVKETDSSSHEFDTNDEQSNSLKRKRTGFYTEDLQKSPVKRSPLRLSFSEQTPINHIENAILHKSSSMPQLKSTPNSGLISRKNLLSLSKRKKFNSPRTIGEVYSAPKTPEKTFFQDNTNETPNLKEFFDSVSTSTPRLIRNIGLRKDDKQQTKEDSCIDTDFRQINWDDVNSSVRVCKTSSIADLNVSHSEVSPSPKQRIERLKMYGEPPPISPILMANKCRPSGLRRGRSRMKP